MPWKWPEFVFLVLNKRKEDSGDEITEWGEHVAGGTEVRRFQSCSDFSVVLSPVAKQLVSPSFPRAHYITNFFKST